MWYTYQRVKDSCRVLETRVAALVVERRNIPNVVMHVTVEGALRPSFFSSPFSFLSPLIEIHAILPLKKGVLPFYFCFKFYHSLGFMLFITLPLNVVFVEN